MSPSPRPLTPPDAAPPAASVARGLRILLVDDDPDDRRLIERQLHEHIARVSVTHAGDAAALQAALTQPIDLVVTEYALRWCNGTDVLREIRRRVPGCPVIMFSASGNEEVVAEAMKEGLDDYITKSPTHFARIAHAVLACCERASQRAELGAALERERLALARLQVALQSARMATWELDLKTGARRYSDELGPLFGRARGFAYPDDQSWLRDIHPQDRAPVLESLRAAIRTRSDYFAEYRTLGADGVQRWVQSSGRVLTDAQGEAALMIGTARDVTDWVATREALRAQQEELRTIFDVMPVGVAVSHDARGADIHVTPYFARLLGMGEETHASLSGDYSRAPFTMRRRGSEVAPEDLPMQRAARSGQRVAGDELDVVRRDGSTLTILCNAAPLFDDDGSVRGAVCVMVDVTDLKRVQQELELADRQKNEFLATLAHELRNPLAPIRYSVALLQSGDADSVRKAREVIERQTAHMSRLLDDLLDLSRITRNKIELLLHTVDLRRIVELGYENAHDMLDQNRHAFTLSLPPQPLWVCGDEVRLTQVVSNLLNNAAKFTPSGGCIRVSGASDGDMAVIRVRDTGIGVAREDLSRIFEMFSQASPKMSGASPGLGIGLAVVRSIVRMHGGEVVAESPGLGLGTEVCVRLPLVEAPPASVPSVVEAVDDGLDGCRALVVDDNRDAADALAELLRTVGCCAHVAYDGEEARQAALEFRPDTVVLDLGMPRANGFEVARWIRQQPWGAPVYLIAVTGWGQQEDRAATRAAGFDAHLVKPVTPAEIVRLIGARGRRADSE